MRAIRPEGFPELQTILTAAGGDLPPNSALLPAQALVVISGFRHEARPILLWLRGWGEAVLGYCFQAKICFHG